MGGPSYQGKIWAFSVRVEEDVCDPGSEGSDVEVTKVLDARQGSESRVY